ncbi:hypothetical protein NKI98_29390 [Mesorhizobium sp. M0222]|uniref:hypothetical protein n=1 Tax=Mesorhizobium sp. M0222 TaxID=2956921 RepID=UPI00333921E8
MAAAGIDAVKAAVSGKLDIQYSFIRSSENKTIQTTAVDLTSGCENMTSSDAGGCTVSTGAEPIQSVDTTAGTFDQRYLQCGDGQGIDDDR